MLGEGPEKGSGQRNGRNSSQTESWGEMMANKNNQARNLGLF